MTARAQNQANLKEGQNAGRDEYDGLDSADGARQRPPGSEA